MMGLLKSKESKADRKDQKALRQEQRKAELQVKMRESDERHYAEREAAHKEAVKVEAARQARGEQH